jgi:hypothetical protein
MMPGPRTIRALMGVDRLALELNLLDPAVLQALTEGLRARKGTAAAAGAAATPGPPAAGRLHAEALARCGLRPSW